MKRGALVLLLCLFSARAARAEEPSVAQPERRWYGWQVMISDAAAVGLIYAGATIDSPVLLGVGISAAFAAPALIHLAHGSPGDAAKSFLVRAVPLGLSYAIFALLHPECSEGCSELLIPFTGLILSGAGVVADWAFFSTETIQPRISVRPTLPMGDRSSRGLALAWRF